MSAQKDTEFYPTPDDLAAFLFERLRERIPSGTFKQALEPSAGMGAFVRAMVKEGAPVTAVDPYHDDPRIEGADWDSISLEDLHELLEGDRPFDLACGNPPFSLAEKHLRLLMDMLMDGGHIGFLLRSGFLSSNKRSEFFQEFPPKHVYILARRPSFVWSWTCKDGKPPVGCKHKWFTPIDVMQKRCPECGGTNLSLSKTDQYDYMFAVWEVGWKGTTTMSWLNYTKEVS